MISTVSTGRVRHVWRVDNHLRLTRSAWDTVNEDDRIVYARFTGRQPARIQRHGLRTTETTRNPLSPTIAVAALREGARPV